MNFDIEKILKIFGEKPPKERGELMDHTFIFVGGFIVFISMVVNVNTLPVTNVIDSLIYPLMPFFICLGLILGSFPLCKYAVKNYI